MTPLYKITATLEFHRPVAPTAMDRDAMAGAGEQFGLHGRVTSIRPSRQVSGGRVEVEIEVEYALGGRADPELIGLIFEELDSTEAESFQMQVEKETQNPFAGSITGVHIYQHQAMPPGRAMIGSDPGGPFSVIGSVT